MLPDIPLPLMLEQTARWYLFTVPVCGAIVFIIARQVLKAYRQGWSSVTPPAFAVWIAITAFSAWVVLLPIGWSLRLDRDGITLTSPLEFHIERGTIAWPDLRQIRFGRTSGSRAYPSVEFIATDGRVLTLDPLDAVPASYWPALASVVEANAPRIWLDLDRKEWLAAVAYLAQHEPGAFPVRGYRARDGTGRELP